MSNAPTASESPTQDAVARNIRVQMARVDLDGKALADLLGVAKQWVYRRINNQADITMRDLDRIAPHLRTSPQALVTGTED